MKKFKFLSICCLLFMCFLIPTHAENMDGGDYIPPGTPEPKYDSVYKDCLIDDYECISSHIEGIGAGTPEDYKQAIRSFDLDIAEQEKNKDYLNNFMNSTMTAMTENVSLLKPHTIVMQIANFLVTIFEAVGGTCTLLCLIAFNLTSGSFIETTVMGTLDNVTKSIFNWSNTGSWIYNILFLIAMIALVKKILVSMARRGGTTNTKSIAFMILETICSVAMIVFIGLYGRPIIHYIESTAETSIVQTFTFGEDNTDPLEIRTKDKIFDIMQIKPFMMRHFGTSDITRLPMNENAIYEDLLSYNTGRVKSLLSEPSTEKALAEKEIGNNIIPQGIGTSVASVGISFIGLIHKIIASCILLPLIIGLGAIRLIKEILLFFSIFGLIFMLLNPKNSKAYTWFFNRLMWMLVSILSEVAFSIILFTWTAIMNSVTGSGFILAIVFDIILLVLFVLTWKFKDVIISKFKEITANTNADGIFNGIITGDLSPVAAMSLLSEHSESTSLPSNYKNKELRKENDNSSFSSQDYNDDLADRPEGCIDDEVHDNENIDNTSQSTSEYPSLQEEETTRNNNVSKSSNPIHKNDKLDKQFDDPKKDKEDDDDKNDFMENIPNKENSVVKIIDDDMFDYDDSLSDEMQNQQEGNYPMNHQKDALNDNEIKIQKVDDTLTDENNDSILEETSHNIPNDDSLNEQTIIDDLLNDKEVTSEDTSSFVQNTFDVSNTEDVSQHESDTNYDELAETPSENLIPESSTLEPSKETITHTSNDEMSTDIFKPDDILQPESSMNYDDVNNILNESINNDSTAQEPSKETITHTSDYDTSIDVFKPDDMAQPKLNKNYDDVDNILNRNINKGSTTLEPPEDMAKLEVGTNYNEADEIPKETVTTLQEDETDLLIVDD